MGWCISRFYIYWIQFLLLICITMFIMIGSKYPHSYVFVQWSLEHRWKDKHVSHNIFLLRIFLCMFFFLSKTKNNNVFFPFHMYFFFKWFFHEDHLISGQTNILIGIFNGEGFSAFQKYYRDNIVYTIHFVLYIMRKIMPRYIWNTFWL